MQEPKNTRFVKIHPNFSCMFSTTEISFLVLILDQEYLKEIGFDSNWSRAYFQKSMKTGNEAFVKCTSRLEGMGLLSISEKRFGNKKCYSLNIAAYNMALNILNTTNNRAALHKFCDTNFIEQKRKIEDISKEELEALSSTRKFQKKSTMFETDILFNESCPDQTLCVNSSSSVMSETHAFSEKTCLKQTYSSVNPGDESVYCRIIHDLDMEIERLLSLKGKYVSESSILPEKVYMNQTYLNNDEKLETMSETDILLPQPCLNPVYSTPKNEETMSETDILSKKPCLKPTYSIEKGCEIVSTMSETDILSPKNKETMSVSDISIDNIYNNINYKSKSIEEDKEYILENNKNASERSIFYKGGKDLDFEKVSSPSSQNQKFIDALIRDMQEEFPEGDKPKRTEVQDFFSELKEDYLSHDPELSQLTIEDIFPHFQSSGIRICTYYSEHIEKTEEELKEEFMSLPVSEDFDESLLGLSDQEKIEIIKEDFRQSFPEEEQVELEDMTHYVVGYMRDLELMRVDRVLYDSPQLLIHMFPELQKDKDSKLWFRAQNKPQNSMIGANDGKFIRIEPKFKEEAENAKIESNPFYDRLKKFRFPRLTISSSGTCNASEVIPKVLIELGYENGIYEDPEVIDQILDVIIDKFKLQGRGFESFQNIWLYCDRYHHKQKGKVLIQNLPEQKKMKA